MSDRELAEKIVALGIVSRDSNGIHYYHPASAIEPALKASQVVRDWRVAGKLMEKCIERPGQFVVTEDAGGTRFATRVEFADYPACRILGQGAGDNLARTIIEACVTALEES